MYKRILVIGALTGASLWIMSPGLAATPAAMAAFEERLFAITQNHPRMKAAAQRLAAALARARYRDGYYPDPVAGITFMEAPYRSNPADLSPKAFTGTEWMISQAIPVPGRLTLESDITDLQARIERLRLIATGNALAASYLQDLTSAWSVERRLALTQEYLGRFQPILSISGSQYALGKGGLADISMARLSSRSLEEKQKRYEKQYRASLARLTYYSSEQPAADDRAAVHPYAESILERIKTEKRSLAELSPELAMASLETQIEGKRTTINRLQYAPDFSLVAKYLRSQAGNAEPPGTLPDNRISVGLTMRLPLWSALQNHHNINEADHLAGAARLQQEDIRRSLEAAKEALLADIESAGERAALYRNRMIPEARRAVLAARAGYQSGRTDFNALLRVWETLYMLEIEAVELQADRSQKIFELARLMNLIQPDMREPR